MKIYTFLGDKSIFRTINCNMNTISLCMIVKDEEKTLARILSIAEKFCDEIIIVDTGSSDDTLKIAKKFTDKIFGYRFNGDFSAARNYAFSFAKCDYLLWLDADDFIDAKNIEKIEKLKKTGLYADIYTFLYNTYDRKNGNLLLSFYRERLLKRDKNYKFYGAVHEAIPLTGNVVFTDIIVEHRKEKTRDAKRNLNIYFLLKKRKYAFSGRDVYYFARELYYNGYYKQAAVNFKKFLKLGGQDADEAEARVLLSDCFIREKSTEKAEAVIIEALKKFVPYPEMLCALGRVYYEKGEYEKSAFYYKTALFADEKKDGFCRPEYKGIIPLLWLTVIYYNLRDYKSAKKYHEECKKIAPTDPSVRFNDKLPLLSENDNGQNKQ